jgi:hypothetical protein
LKYVGWIHQRAPRAQQARGVRMLGKTTMFFNGFPRFVEVALDFFVRDCQVRAGFSQKM